MFRAEIRYREEIDGNNLWTPEGNEEGLYNLWRVGERNRSVEADIESYKEQNIGEEG